MGQPKRKKRRKTTTKKEKHDVVQAQDACLTEIRVCTYPSMHVYMPCTGKHTGTQSPRHSTGPRYTVWVTWPLSLSPSHSLSLFSLSPALPSLALSYHTGSPEAALPLPRRSLGVRANWNILCPPSGVSPREPPGLAPKSNPIHSPLAHGPPDSCATGVCSALHVWIGMESVCIRSPCANQVHAGREEQEEKATTGCARDGAQPDPATLCYPPASPYAPTRAPSLLMLAAR